MYGHPHLNVLERTNAHPNASAWLCSLNDQAQPCTPNLPSDLLQHPLPADHATKPDHQSPPPTEPWHQTSPLYCANGHSHSNQPLDLDARLHLGSDTCPIANQSLTTSGCTIVVHTQFSAPLVHLGPHIDGTVLLPCSLLLCAEYPRWVLPERDTLQRVWRCGMQRR